MKPGNYEVSAGVSGESGREYLTLWCKECNGTVQQWDLHCEEPTLATLTEAAETHGH